MSGVARGGPDIVLIAALDRQRAIGRAGALPWHLPADLKRFKSLTLGKPVLMGRKTAQAIGRALPDRTNLVMAGNEWTPPQGMQSVPSLDAALAEAIALGAGELCVIGGGQIYALVLSSATRMHLTHIDTSALDADAFFPCFDQDEWQPSDPEHHPADARHAFAFDFIDYTRR